MGTAGTACEPKPPRNNEAGHPAATLKMGVTTHDIRATDVNFDVNLQSLLKLQVPRSGSSSSDPGGLGWAQGSAFLTSVLRIIMVDGGYPSRCSCCSPTCNLLGLFSVLPSPSSTHFTSFSSFVKFQLCLQDQVPMSLRAASLTPGWTRSPRALIQNSSPTVW